MWRRFWFLVTRRRRLQEIDEEMRPHVELRAVANRRDGLRPSDAERRARVRCGNPLTLRDEVRDVWGFTAPCYVPPAFGSATFVVRQTLRLSLILGFVSLVASYVPAHRAARLEPTLALRGE